MNTTSSLRMLLLHILCSVYFTANAQVSIFSTEELASAITTHELSIDFILIDVRDNGTIANGIIASIYCKPYHLSWNDSVFHHHFATIPRDVPVMIYDQTGTFAMQAARMLADSGYQVVAAIGGGVNAYSEELADTTFLNPRELLPQRSYFGDLSGTGRHRQHPEYQPSFLTVNTVKGNNYFLFNGKQLRQTSDIRPHPGGCLIIHKHGIGKKSIVGIRNDFRTGH